MDTHAVVWVSQQPEHLSAPSRLALTEGRKLGDLAIADFTLRELAVLITMRRVTVSTSLEVYLKFVESVFQVIPVNAQIAAQSVRFSSRYPKDPADRLIGATAVVHGARLVTKDELIRASGEVDCVW